MPVDLRRGGITGVAVDVKVGWWEGVILTSDGLLWAWNFFDQPSDGIFRPAVYQYILAEGQCVRAVHVVSSPLFSAVFSKLEGDKTAEKARGAAAAPSAIRTRPSVNPNWDPMAYN
ncbi:myosin H [Toxoplasma gondii VAND]|nr:myosin H [Toxoplasma gondii VAND]